MYTLKTTGDTLCCYQRSCQDICWSKEETDVVAAGTEKQVETETVAAASGQEVETATVAAAYE